MAGVFDRFLRKAFGTDVVNHANSGRVEIVTKILHVVLENDLT